MLKGTLMTSNQLRIVFTFAVSILSSVALAEDGASDRKIVFGQVAALSGGAGFGQGMRQGILAAFEDANRHGGVSGRTLELRSLDDLRTRKDCRSNQEDHRRRQSLRHRRGGGYAHLEGRLSRSPRQRKSHSSVPSPAPNFYAIPTTVTSSTFVPPILRRPRRGSST